MDSIHGRLFTRWVRAGLLCACGARRNPPMNWQTEYLRRCDECGIWLARVPTAAQMEGQLLRDVTRERPHRA